jgi:hypothetical protein
LRENEIFIDFFAADAPQIASNSSANIRDSVQLPIVTTQKPPTGRKMCQGRRVWSSIFKRCIFPSGNYNLYYVQSVFDVSQSKKLSIKILCGFEIKNKNITLLNSFDHYYFDCLRRKMNELLN